MENKCLIPKIYHPQGNYLSLSIDMTLRTMTAIGGKPSTEEAPFVPSGSVRAVLQSNARTYSYDVQADGSVATLADNGTLPVGVYSIELRAKGGDGHDYRYKERNVLSVVDYSREAGILPPVEFHAETRHLAATFAAMGSIAEETDPTVPQHVKDITQDDIKRWDSKQDKISNLDVLLRVMKNAVTDADYVHTDNNFTDEEKEKLGDLENYDDTELKRRVGELEGAEQVQSDWSEADESSPAYIRNKPTIPTMPDVPTRLSQLADDATHRTVTDAEKTSWGNKQDALTFDDVPTKSSNNPVKSGGVFDALAGKVDVPANTVYVTQAYWLEKGANTFTQANTHYILVEDLYDLSYDNNSRSFGKNCVLSANPGCRFGRCSLTFNDTYIDAGMQHIFRCTKYENPTRRSGTVIDGTTIGGTFANSRILVEWWGAKGGRGYKAGYSFANARTEEQALNNAYAFNEALYCAGNSEVYAPAPMYMIGASICDNSSTLTDGISKDKYDKITSFTKLYVEGDLVASNEFIGCYKTSGSAWVEVPAIVYINGNLPRCIIRGAVIVPPSAQDKEIVIGSVPSTLTDANVGEMYFVQNGDYYDVYDVYYHYTSNSGSDKEVAVRKVGHFNTTSTLLNNYKNTSNKYGGSNGKIPGMYGLNVSSIGGLVEVGRIIKGDMRAGFWNVTQDNKLMSYRYRKEVMHQGQCTALGLRCVKSTTIKIGQIEGFNDGVAFDGTHSPDYDGVEFNRFEIGSIACNHAVHGTVGDSCYACLVDKDKSTAYYFDSCRWILGGFEHFAAGNNGLHCFCPTTSKSTYFLVEWAGNSHTGGFSCHWVEWNTAPLRWYTSIIDIAHAKDNQFIMHGNSSGDTGRVVLWLTEDNIRTNLSGIWSKLDGVQTVEGETNAMFPYDSFVGIESLSKRPYAYADLAAMSNPANTWQTTTEYSYDGRLAPYSGSTLLYSEWACPYNSTRNYINFRTGSYHNVVRGGRDHMLCYNSVYSDSQSGMNELRHCQSAQAMFVEGNYTVFNANHPVFDIVRFDRDNDPRNHHNSGTHVTEGGDKRVMFVPDENTLSCLQAVDAVADISANGLYIIKGLSDTSDSSGSYKQTRYQLYERYGSGTNVQVGWISGIFLSLIESGGGSVDLSGYYTKTEIDSKGYLTQHQDISGKADKVTVVEVDDTGDVAQALDANTFYKFTALTSLTLTLNAGSELAIYAGKFTTGSGWGSNGLSIPATVTEAANNDEIAASKTYEFSIMDNVIVVKEV